MHIVTDADVVTFTDDGGDTLTLLSTPRQRDVEASDAIEREEMFEAIAAIGSEAIGAAIAEATPEQVKAAQEANATEEDDPVSSSAKVREFRYRALVVTLTDDRGQKHGGDAAKDAYGDFDPKTARWVDERVGEVWQRAIPSDADTRGA